jgi:anaerobic selenocysteine-containing dehydrogenase
MDLPDELREGAVVFGLALRAAMQLGPSIARAGFGGTPLEAATALWKAIIENPSGIVFAVDEWSSILPGLGTPDRKIHADLPDLLAELRTVLATPPAAADPAFPFVLTAGERRSFTANTIIRDPRWRKKDGEGALRMSPDDAASLRVTSGDVVRLSTRSGSAVVRVEISDSMRRGHIALPNGLGLGYPRSDGYMTTGVAPNELTASDHRDRFVGTPLHKNVPANVERIES